MNLFGVELGPADLWLLASAAACLAWFVPHRLSLSRELRSARRHAGIRFRSAVLGALSGLYPVPSNWPSNKLRIIEDLEARFPGLQTAVEEFRPHLPLHKRWLFQRAWRVYRLGEDGRLIDGQYYWQYVPHTGEGYEGGRHYKHDNRATYQSTFKKNVDRLLSFASEA